ncbi:MAG: hypothetical protein KIT09_20830 [Bryobacteraceae bacterium]|nr:hypothetical protein [Bryobacteraceae bacterium]
MFNVFRLTPFMAVACLTCLAQTPELTREGDYWIRTTSGAISPKAARKLKIQAPGAVRVKGEPSPVISYSVRERVRARTAEEAQRAFSLSRAAAGQGGDWVQLTLPPPGASLIPELTVVVPGEIAQIVVNGHTGDIHLDGLDADVTAGSFAGRIVAETLGGALVASTGGGEIRLGSVAGAIRCISGGGSIRVERCGGEAFLQTAGGEIQIGEAAGPVTAATRGGNIYVGSAGSAVSARTAQGIIQVKSAGGKVVAETASGSIEIGGAPDARCSSASGAIRLTGIAGSLRASTAAGDILAEILAGQNLAASSLATSFGDITVFIPSNVAMTVKANSVPAGVSGTIVSDFPEIRLRKTGAGAYGPQVAEGSLNGGGPVFTLTATGGTVYLRRR